MEDKFNVFTFEELNVLENCLDFRKRDMDVRDSRYPTISSMLLAIRHSMSVKVEIF